MRYLTTLLLGVGLIACSEPAPKTGAMPGVATGGYDAPSNAEAAAAYMKGFQDRYDIPELDYPQDIKDRIQKARINQFSRHMHNGQKRQKIMAHLGLIVTKDPETKKLLEGMKNVPTVKLGENELARLFALAESQSNIQGNSNSERKKIYEKAVTDYKSHFKNLKIETCRWTEMRRLIGSGHEEMALIHGHHPTHGFLCAVNLILEKRKGYPRTIILDGFWVKSQSGDWEYYGKFRGVGLKPRLQQLDPALLRDPERTIKRQSVGDMIARSFN